MAFPGGWDEGNPTDRKLSAGAVDAARALANSKRHGGTQLLVERIVI